MENFSDNPAFEPRYTKMWIGLQILYVFVIAGVLTLISLGITSLAGSRFDAGLLTEDGLTLVNESTSYCFAMISITLLSITLIEIVYRRRINIVQYVLIGCALCLFFLLLLSMGEQMPFWGAYIIVSLMTIGLISCFIRALNRSNRAAAICAGILTVEYGLLYVLVSIGSMVLLAGSLLLFAIIALAMYVTVRMKIENEEIVLR